jgi:polar amino acid transport system substrate-binding protein
VDNETITVCYVDRYPYHYSTDGIIRGLVAEPADYALKKSSLSYRWQEMPAKRMMIIAKENKEKMAMVGWFKNPEREKIYKFSIPVYQDKTFLIIAKKGNENLKKNKSFKALLADRNLILLVKDGYSYGIVFDNLIKEKQTNTYKVTVDMIKMVQMINAGRGDYMFSNQEEGEYLIKSAGIPRENLIVKSYPDSPRGEYRYILFSRLVSEDEIKTINSYIKEYLDTHSE